MRYSMFLPLEIVGSTPVPNMIKVAAICDLLHDLYEQVESFNPVYQSKCSHYRAIIQFKNNERISERVK